MKNRGEIVLKATMFLAVVMLIALVIVDVFARIYTFKGKKMHLNVKAYDSLNNMLALHENNKATATPQIHIEESKMHYYHPQRNSIGIRSFDLSTVYDNVASLHEGGHYLSINQSPERHIVFLISQYVVGINRLIIIPIFLIAAYMTIFEKSSFLLNETFLTIALIIFIIASIFRVCVGLPEEYYASKYAMDFIKNNFDRSVIKYAYRFLVSCFLSYCFLVITMVIAIPLLYKMLVIILSDSG